MDQFSFIYLIGLIPAFAAAAFILVRLRSRARINKLPEFCIGAIRVTREGRDMLIIRKEDGSFEMLEEEKARKQCVL